MRNRILLLAGLAWLLGGCAAPKSALHKAEAVGVQAGPAAAGDYADLWERIRAGFRLPPIHNATVRRYERWYAARPRYVAHMVERARRYLYYIVEQVEARGMPTEIALLPAIESAYKPLAYSRARAAGLWQFIPSTGRLYGLRQNWWYDGRRDVIQATEAALNYLEKLHRQFDGDWHLALAAYNAGERRIERSMAHNARRGRATDYQSLRRLKRETRHYVPKLIAVVNIVADPAAHGLTLPPIPNRPYFDIVPLPGQVDLGVVAKAAGIPVRELHALNPGFRRWATDPEGPHRLLVPVAKREAVVTALAKLPPEHRMQYARYVVRRGDTLGGIARRHRVTVGALRRTNKLRGHLIRAGQNLLIPLSARRLAAARTPPAAGRGRPIIHRVRRGETLYAIARRYNVYVRQLARWNGIEVDGVLRMGQRLKIIR